MAAVNTLNKKAALSDSLSITSGNGVLLHTHYLYLFILGEFIDLTYVCVRVFLNLFQSAALIILGDRLVFQELLQTIIRRVTHVSYSDAMILGDLANLLGELFSAFFVQRRHGQADYLAVI